MVRFFDTHAHFEGTDEETSSVLSRARAAGVTHILAIGGSAALNEGVARAAARAPADMRVLRCIGWDRDQIAHDLPALDFSGVSAIGEIGLDYHYAPRTRRAQMALMGRQLEQAAALDLPVVIHTREADDDTLGLLREIPSRGVIHCFTGTVPFCRKLLDLGWSISFSGIVTFKSAESVRAAARFVPDDRLLLETDAPFLAPHPHRGKPNEPAFVTLTAAAVAAERRMPLEVLTDVTFRNACDLLGLAADL